MRADLDMKAPKEGAFEMVSLLFTVVTDCAQDSAPPLPIG